MLPIKHYVPSLPVHTSHLHVHTLTCTHIHTPTHPPTHTHTHQHIHQHIHHTHAKTPRTPSPHTHTHHTPHICTTPSPHSYHILTTYVHITYHTPAPHSHHTLTTPSPHTHTYTAVLATVQLAPTQVVILRSHVATAPAVTASCLDTTEWVCVMRQLDVWQCVCETEAAWCVTVCECEAAWCLHQ